MTLSIAPLASLIADIPIPIVPRLQA